jgi:hypothetical protein
MQAGDSIQAGDYNTLIGYDADVSTSGISSSIAIGLVLQLPLAIWLKQRRTIN